jgi:hypothetical protein
MGSNFSRSADRCRAELENETKSLFLVLHCRVDGGTCLFSIIFESSWIEPGEWFNITVDAAQASTYVADFLYTAKRGGTISIDVDGVDNTGPLQITSTNDPSDPLAWRQWHHWNLAPQLFRVRLNKGKNVLTVHILTNGNMNLAYFDFRQVHV